MNLVKSQTNVKEIKVFNKLKGIKVTFKPDYTKLGKAFGDKTQKIAEALQKADQDSIISDIEENNKHVLKLDQSEYEIIKDHLVYERASPDHLQEAEFKDGFVYLDKTRTPELEAEGFAREIVHRVQTMRRAAGYEIADHIFLYYEGAAHFVQSISAFADYIRQETLAIDIDEGITEEADLQDTFKIGGTNLKLGVKKAV